MRNNKRFRIRRLYRKRNGWAMPVGYIQPPYGVFLAVIKESKK